MNEWKIIESLPGKIVTQEDSRIKGSWIAPLLLVLPGLVPIWLGIPILPATLFCQPVGISSLQCKKKQEFLGIPIQSQSYTQPASKPKPSIWKFESNGKITTHKLGKCFAEYTFKDIAGVEIETLEEGKNANNICRYRVNLVTINGKRLPVSEFISEDLDATNTSYAKIRANQVSDRLRQFTKFPAVQ
ncbi:hypothetical protein H6G54_16855 [Anabaena cylindrica FACHB-243]|uniref:Uncharacterized protein n=1 Tax=Anabaena cylindrica (strain ATCC 27899 / PCC 7122) TaxID=272123 RepID=K9ZEZ7_ANACC|nr:MULTISPECIES: hypothetical protein [Anabaena]AFZ57751.1 hypothetical protein Anacy_2295 [Anabaena cylindrica PCC 7122]AZL96645.1 hypothetical protein [Anabaena sp. CCAP 1446/1C]MBD2419339.1 hypothetical protein [Anabaena cylindrica FACHB-243]MBY5282155.1 hypothetical protein [Anabaena sp. CCAP 1446/1C]MBY5307670.1 hypothetical protein [Anabaena sp. CCAP 1446/1C]